METKANYVAVGAFVLVCVVGLVVALLWLVGAQYSQEYSYYETHFTGAVTGLGKGTVVRYNGIEVGRVANLDFDPEDPKVVIAKLEVQHDLVLHEDSVASIESQGLAGGSYVLISGGKKDSPILKAKRGQRYPVIKSKPSSLEALFQGTPELIARLNVLSARLVDLVNDENRAAIASTLTNLRDTTSVVNRHSADIDTMLANFATMSKQLNVTIANVDSAARRLDQLALNADHLVSTDGPQLIGQARALVSSITRLSNQLDREPTRLLFGDRHEGYKPQ